MTPGGALCPMPDRVRGQGPLLARDPATGRPTFSGRHAILVTEWGMACGKCSATWEWVGAELVRTWVARLWAQ